MTSPPSSPRTTAQPGRWCVSLFLVLAGLFGMHGLASHGPCDMPAMTGAAMRMAALPDAANGSGVVVTAPDAAHRMTTAIATGAGVFEGVARVTTAGGGHRHCVVGLCLAVLAGAVIALALLARRPARGITVPVDRRGVRLGGRGRDRDPPSLTRLSIRRC